MTPEERRAWKREQGHKPLMFQAQPRYRGIVRLGPMRFGMTVRHADGTTAVHELGRIAKRS